MNRILEDLWNGVIAPGENCGVGDPEIENLVVLIERNKEALSQGLGQQQKEQLENCLHCYEEYTHLLCAQAFSDGFCLAGKLWAAVFTEDLSSPEVY